MTQATLCILIKDNKEILLAMKKRGFGKGKWNGVGGKLDYNRDKNIVDTAIRETKEEIGVDIRDIEKVAILKFKFPYNRGWDQDVHVFLTNQWDGEPSESEEMMPKWFDLDKIPFKGMWDDDKFWLPDILKGKKIKADFTFKEGEIIDKRDIRFIEEF